jgi:hypothetical protein
MKNASLAEQNDSVIKADPEMIRRICTSKISYDINPRGSIRNNDSLFEVDFNKNMIQLN